MLIEHPSLGLVEHEAVEVSDDPDRQVAQTIDIMRAYVREDSRTPEVAADAQLALSALNSLPYNESVTDRQRVEAVFSHVKGRVGFQRDEQIAESLQPYYRDTIVEALIRPVDMASMCNRGECRRVGDCDDYAMYAAALLRALGIKVAFVTLAADEADPSRYSHVYVAAYTHEGERIPVDVSHGPYAGWEAPNLYGKRREWDIDGPSMWKWLAALAGVLAMVRLVRTGRVFA